MANRPLGDATLCELVHAHPVDILRKRIDDAVQDLYVMGKYIPEAYLDLRQPPDYIEGFEPREPLDAQQARRETMWSESRLIDDAKMSLRSAERAAIGVGVALEFGAPGQGGEIETEIRSIIHDMIGAVDPRRCGPWLCSDDPADFEKWRTATGPIGGLHDRLRHLAVRELTSEDIADRIARIRRLCQAADAHDQPCTREGVRDPEYDDEAYEISEVRRSLQPIAAWVAYAYQRWETAIAIEAESLAEPWKDLDHDKAARQLGAWVDDGGTWLTNGEEPDFAESARERAAWIEYGDEIEDSPDFIEQLVEFLGAVLEAVDGNGVRQASRPTVAKPCKSGPTITAAGSSSGKQGVCIDNVPQIVAKARLATKKKRMKPGEAEMVARDLLQNDTKFHKATIRKWAERIGCSVGTVEKLPSWIDIMKNRAKAKCSAPRAVDLSDKVLATAKQRTELTPHQQAVENEELDVVLKDCQDNFEPSPLDDTRPEGPPNPTGRKTV